MYVCTKDTLTVISVVPRKFVLAIAVISNYK
jgi:hypothetical protein